MARKSVSLGDMLISLGLKEAIPSFDPASVKLNPTIELAISKGFRLVPRQKLNSGYFGDALSAEERATAAFMRGPKDGYYGGLMVRADGSWTYAYKDGFMAQLGKTTEEFTQFICRFL